MVPPAEAQSVRPSSRQGSRALAASQKAASVAGGAGVLGASRPASANRSRMGMGSSQGGKAISNA